MSRSRTAATAALLAEIEGIQPPTYEPSPPTVQVRASTAAANG